MFAKDAVCGVSMDIDVALDALPLICIRTKTSIYSRLLRWFAGTSFSFQQG